MKKMLKRGLGVLLAVSLIAGLAACGSTAGTPSSSPTGTAPASTATPGPSGESGGHVKNLVVGTSSQPETTSIVSQQGSLGKFNYNSITYANLFYPNKDNEMQPYFLKSYKISDDARELEMTFPTTSIWHDGTPVTTDDFVFTFEYRRDVSDTAPDAYPAGENEIGFGNAAMVVNASWVPGEITNNTSCDLEWGMFNYPTVDGGKDPATVANVGAQALGIPSKSENIQEAFDLVTMITSGKYDQEMALKSNGIPADTRNTEWPEMIAGCRGAFNALTNVYDWNCGLNDNGDMSEVMQDGAMKLFNGTYTGQQFIDAMAAAKK